MAKAATQEPVSVSAIVRQVWDSNAGDMPGAVDALYAEVTSHPQLMAQIMPSIVRAWCREQIGGHVAGLRVAAIPSPETASQGSRLRVAIAATLFDFPLPGGKRLGDANALEIRSGASAYQQTAQDAAHKARFLLKVAERVGRKNRCESALTLAQVEALYEEARHA